MLSALALRAKAHWGYSIDFIEACRAELTWSPVQLSAPGYAYVIAEISGAIVGFYALQRLSATLFELDALFVEPERIGQGIGRALVEHAKEMAAKQGGRTLIVQADPHAESFYRAAGGMITGKRESGSIPGRYLPVLTIPLQHTNAA